jgi:hypothetical protein
MADPVTATPPVDLAHPLDTLPSILPSSVASFAQPQPAYWAAKSGGPDIGSLDIGQPAAYEAAG